MTADQHYNQNVMNMHKSFILHEYLDGMLDGKVIDIM